MQALHKNQKYYEMTSFLYGPLVDEKNKNSLAIELSNANFGYSMKRVGIKELNVDHWSLTYRRTILGTNETFKIECSLIKDTCKIYLDKSSWEIIFDRKILN